jgi:hypothetical protein
MRHYSKVIIETPDPGDPPTLVIHFECDQCGPHEWRTHIQHLGTLTRILVDTYAKRGGDDGHTELLGEATGHDVESLRARLRSAFQAFKGRRKDLEQR